MYTPSLPPKTPDDDERTRESTSRLKIETTVGARVSLSLAAPAAAAAAAAAAPIYTSIYYYACPSLFLSHASDVISWTHPLFLSLSLSYTLISSVYTLTTNNQNKMLLKLSSQKVVFNGRQIRYTWFHRWKPKISLETEHTYIFSGGQHRMCWPLNKVAAETWLRDQTGERKCLIHL
jgi:hypothetical protein